MTDQRRPVFDKQDQLDKIAINLFPGESVIAVYDAIGAGTGVLGLTIFGLSSRTTRSSAAR